MFANEGLRSDWTLDEVRSLYHQPLLELIFQAATVHRQRQATGEVQVCTLLSIKTGGCPEDCAYCPQAARYHTDVKTQKLMEVSEVLDRAAEAKAAGSTRFCLGAAWREVRDNRDFDRVLDMIRGVSGMGMEVCCTLGMLTPEQARRMKEAGLHAYNHNLDTSEEHYGDIITTRTYEDRLRTLANVREAGLTMCTGGIVGLGETDEDRIGMLHTLATLAPHPESVPINALVAVEGTPLADQPPVDALTMARMIATARILMPGTMVRLSAGRVSMTEAEQALCFLAGANSVFSGDRLLTTPNNGADRDSQLFQKLGLSARPAFKEQPVAAE